jgi:phage terminase large subunit-like protein
MAPQQNTFGLPEIFGIVEAELDRAIVKPSIYAYEPYSDQLEFHQSDAPGKYVSGGNRAGKTTSVVIESIWWAMDIHPYRERPEGWGHGAIQQRFVAVDIDKGILAILKPAFQRWIPREYLIDGSFDKSWSPHNVLTFKNGSTIDFLTYNMALERHGGVPRHIIYFDEEPPRDLFNEGQMRLMDYDGWWVISATPVKGMGWTYDLLWEPAMEAAKAGEPYPISVHQLDPANNPYLQAEDRSRFYVAMDKEEREMRETGKFVARSGLVFPNFSPDAHVINPMIPPKHWSWFMSIDHGINNPTAVLWHAVAPDGRIVTFAEHYASDMNIEQHAMVINEREAGWKRGPDRRVGDPAMHQRSGITGTSIIQEYARRGLYIITEGVPHEVMIGVEKMQQYLDVRRQPDGTDRPMWQITSNCVMFIKEMKKLRWAAYDSSRKQYDLNRQEKIHKKDDHAFDSARYFATLMPDLREEDFTRRRAMAPGETGSIWDVFVTQQLAQQYQQPIVSDYTEDSVRWKTEEYADE